jgi:hypothetical protein
MPESDCDLPTRAETVEQVSFKTTAMTANMEWVQRFDGLAISLVDAF